jgi:propionyl-CoA synthetase
MLTHSHDVVAGEREAVQLVRDRIGAVTSFKTALVVTGLPKTRSGKILRGTMRGIADREDYPLSATIDDPAVLGEIDAGLGERGVCEAAARLAGSDTAQRATPLRPKGGDKAGL